MGHSLAKAGVEGEIKAAAEQIVVAGDGIEEGDPCLHIRVGEERADAHLGALY